MMCVHAHHTSAPTRMHTTAEFLARVSRERAAQRSNDEVVAPAAGGAGGGRKADRSQAERALQQELRAAKEQTEVFDRRASVEVAMCVCVRACVCLCTCMVYTCVEMILCRCVRVRWCVHTWTIETKQSAQGRVKLTTSRGSAVPCARTLGRALRCGV